MNRPFAKSKICHVCGDLAFGFNFNGLTCTSCRLFFYRNWNKTLVCPKNRKCEIDFLTRKCCPSCRLAKCFECGMRPRVTRSYARLRTQRSNAKQMSEKIDNNIVRTKHLNDGEVRRAKLSKSIENTSRLVTSSVSASESAIPLGDTIERQMIAEIDDIVAQNFAEELDCGRIAVVTEVNSVWQIVRCTEFYIRQIVRFCKAIAAFRALNNHDQLIVLKPYIFEAVSLRVAFNYDSVNDCIPFFENENTDKILSINLSTLDEMQCKPLLEQNIKCCKSLQYQMENDKVIRNLLMTELLFRSRAHLSCPEYMQYQHSIYCHLLRKYLESKYRDADRAVKKCHSLWQILNKLCDGRENIRTFVAELGTVAKLDGATVEAFNLVD